MTIQLILGRPLMTVEADPSQPPHGLYAAVGAKSGLPMEYYYVVHNGHKLPPGECPYTLDDLGIRAGDTIRIASRLPGGGGDGGVYPPTAHELKWMSDIGGGSHRGSWAVLGGSVRRTQFEKISSGLRRFDAATTCALTGEPLQDPVVCCALGMLYNKMAIYEALLRRDERPLDERFAHIRSSKDLTQVILTRNPNYKADPNAADAVDRGAPFQCPVTQKPFNGRLPFFAVRPSGYVVSEDALAMVGHKACPVTEKALAPAVAPAMGGTEADGAGGKCTSHSPDLIQLVLDEEEMAAARERLAVARVHKAGKRSGKGADGGGKRPKAAAPAAVGVTAGVAGSSCAGASMGPAQRPAAAGGSTLAQRAVASAHAEAQRKEAASDVYKSLFVTKEARKAQEEAARAGKDYMTRSIALPVGKNAAADLPQR